MYVDITIISNVISSERLRIRSNRRFLLRNFISVHVLAMRYLNSARIVRRAHIYLVAAG